MSIEESGLGRWARLKKARKDRKDRGAGNNGTTAAPDAADGKTVRGKAAPTTYPVETGGAYRPWMPPLATAAPDAVPAVTGTEDDSTAADAPEQISADALSVEEAAIAEEMGLPDIEMLDKESDFSMFMKDGVPDKLRRLALRKLWSSNPLFGFRDGLNDYDEDFRSLSDYVHNVAAMRRFTEPDSESEDTQDETAQTTDATETSEVAKAEEQTAGDQEERIAESGSAAENTDEVSESCTDDALRDIEPDDDPELG